MAGLLNGTLTSPEVAAGQVTDSAAAMVNGHVAGAATPLASFNWMLNVPAAVGVPVIAPVEEFKVRPAGSDPLATENVNGATPPLTLIVGLVKGTFASPKVA